MASYYTYGEMPDAEQTVYGVSSLDSYFNNYPFELGANFSEPPFNYSSSIEQPTPISQYEPAFESIQPTYESEPVYDYYSPIETPQPFYQEEPVFDYEGERRRVEEEARLAREAEDARRAEEEARTRREAEAARREQERIAAEQARLEQERQAEMARQAEAQRQAEMARQEAERQAAIQRQQELEAMQRRQAEIESQRQEQLRQENIRQEQIRQAEVTRQQEVARQAQARQEAERQRQMEEQRQAEILQQQEIARQQEIERQQQLAEMQRRQAEQEEAKRAQENRAREEARQAEIERQEMARRAEAQRVAREQQLAREAEAARVAEEQARTAREAEAARVEQERIAVEQRRVEEARQAEAARVAEQARQAEASRVAEQARQAEVARQEQAARQAELDRLAQQQEAARVAAEQEAARVAAEEAARAQSPVSPLQSAVEKPRETIMPAGDNEIITAPPLAATIEEPMATSPLSAAVETTMPTGEEERLEEPVREFTQPTYEEEKIAELTQPQESPLSYTVPGATLPVDVSSMDFDAGQKAMALMSLVDPAALSAMNFQVGDAAFGGGASGGPNTMDYYRNVAPDTVGGQGSFYEEGALEAYKEAAKDPTQGIFKSGFEALAGEPGIAEAIAAKTERDLGALAKVESDFDVMKPLSDLLKANKFKEAFDYAKDKGIEEKLMQSNWLAQLRQPFSAEEMQAFFKAMPSDFAGSKFNFMPEMGKQSAADSGYPDPQSVYQRKEDTTIKDVVRFGLDVMLAAAGVPPLSAAATKAAYTLAETGGDVEAAIKAGAAAAVGAKVGQVLKAPSISDLTEVVPAGLVKGGTGAASNAAASAAASGATSGLTGGALQEFVVQAAKAAAPSLAESSIRTVASNALDQVLKPSAPKTEGAAPAAEKPVGGLETPDGLEEVVVQSLRKAAPVDINTLLASTATAGTQDILSDRQIQEAQEQAAREAEPKPEELEEVKVTGRKLPIEVSPLDLSSAAAQSALTRGVQTPDVTTPVPTDKLQTFKIETDRLKPIDVTDGIVPALSQQIIDTGYKPPKFADTPLDNLEEVVVKGTKPVKSKLDIGDIAAGLGGAAALTQGFTQPKVDPLTGEPKEVPKTQQELDKIQSALATGAAIPGTGGALDSIKGLLEKYGSLENLLKVIGALGAAGSGRTTVPTTGGTAPSLGGALPKYTLSRQQLRPDIDYFTYGTRPEAKFFDYNMQLEKPEPPPAGVKPPSKEEKPMAVGGLTGYADGGSNESRYVDGPGSGREDKIPALLSDGEYVIDAETLALLGDGSTKEGARRMDQFRANIRQHKGRALSRGRISPNAKSPSKYMGGGLT